MEKKKIAESIIIRVGGGIRSIPREPIESDFDESEDMHSLRSGLESTLKKSRDEIIN
jgi:hypothetical protein